MKKILCVFLILSLALGLCACGAREPSPAVSSGDSAPSAAAAAPEADPSPTQQPTNLPSLPGLRYERSMDVRYAEHFAVDYFADGYKLLTVSGTDRYLILPEGGSVPAGLDEDICLIRQPVENIYMAASSAMSLFDALGALDAVTLSSLQKDSWYIENAAAAMEEGSILFAGKYSEPDYELLMNMGCTLAVESTMILHSPKVKEMIELLDIPVLVEHSSYENHPLGRTEWIKVYGALLNREADAEAFFSSQAAVMDELADMGSTDKTVAFFYISSNGSVVIRSGDDYITRMIELGGGRYLFGDYTVDSRSSINITLEEFYARAGNADYLIYNAAIDEPLQSIAELVSKAPLFAEFKAVKNGDVWCTGKDMYQSTDTICSLIGDVNRMLQGNTEPGSFIARLPEN